MWLTPKNDKFETTLKLFVQKFAECYPECVADGSEGQSIPPALCDQLLLEACTETGVTLEDYERACNNDMKLRALQKQCIGAVVLADMKGTRESSGSLHPGAPKIPADWLIPRSPGPDDFEIYMGRGVVCMEIEYYKGAKINFDKMGKLAHGNWRKEASARYHSGCASIGLGEREQAIEDLRYAERLAIQHGEEQLALIPRTKLKELRAE